MNTIGNYRPTRPTRQLSLPLQDGRESQTDRLRRILAGVPKVATAARFFTKAEAERAEAISKEDQERCSLT